VEAGPFVGRSIPGRLDEVLVFRLTGFRDRRPLSFQDLNSLEKHKSEEMGKRNRKELLISTFSSICDINDNSPKNAFLARNSHIMTPKLYTSDLSPYG
jgi:hypothetical protein